ncbi:hypothetical protein ABWK22_01960 [Gottfriedia acidiceleris]|uniref:hypothetical protein n=1 Tax=Gottfriedia acidiceleris TaxID=371036 RepID=UPI003391E89C
MKKFTFDGTAYIKRKISIEIIANNYEQAHETAMNLLQEDVVDKSECYTVGDDEVEIEIDSYEEEAVGSQLDRYEYEDCA